MWLKQALQACAAVLSSMAEREDIITRAFIAALATYQKEHGQKCTYDVTKMPKPTDAAAAADIQLTEPSRGANNGVEEQQNSIQTLNAADQKFQPVLNTAQQAPSFNQHGQRSAGDKQQQQQRSQHTTSLSKVNQFKEPVGQQQQQYDECAANQNSALDDEGMNNWQHNQWQGQQQPPWLQTYNHGGWDTTAAATAAASAGWSWEGCGSQQYVPAPPPPAPPLPPVCFMHTGHQQAQSNSECCICGQLFPTGNQPAATAASRDPAAVLTLIQQQVPTDIAAVPESLQAARAAMDKATAISAMLDSANSMPELLMAWFYAGYHAGRLSSSSSSH